MNDTVTKILELADEYAAAVHNYFANPNSKPKWEVMGAERQALQDELIKAFALQPTNWTVFNSGAQVVEVETFADAWDYMTPERIDRGWTAVCVVDKSNMPHGITGEKNEVA